MDLDLQRTPVRCSDRPASLWQDRHGNPRFSWPPPLMGGLSEEGVGVGIAHWLLMLFHIAGLSTWIRWRIRRERGFSDPPLEVIAGRPPRWSDRCLRHAYPPIWLIVPRTGIVPAVRSG